MRNEQEANHAIELYGDMVKRLCFLHLKNETDTKDIFQTVFLKYILYSGSFQTPEHEKAWLARVTINACKDLLKSFLRRNVTSLDSIPEERLSTTNPNNQVLEAVLALPHKYKTVIYLFYYEDYKATEIAEILNKNENTIYTWLSRAKLLLKEKLGGEYFE